MAFEIIVKFAPKVTEEQADQFLESINVETIEKTKSLKFYRVDISKFRRDLFDIEERIEKFRQRFVDNNLDIEYVEENVSSSITSAETPNDGVVSNQDGLKQINAPQSWKEATGEGVVVGVIDIGVDYRHPDLRNNTWINPGEILNNIDDDGNGYVDDIRGWDFVDEDNNPSDINPNRDIRGHGTAVAGVIAASGNNPPQGIAGVSWGASIMSLRAIGDGSTLFDILQAIEYATANGAHVTNNSWGVGLQSQSLQDVIRQAPLFVAAAGNGGFDIDGVFRQFPAELPSANIVSVAAIEQDNRRLDSSNIGRLGVDIGAPGNSIYTTNTRSEDTSSYRERTGTSFAAPHVAGAAALLIEKLGTSNPRIVKEALLSQIVSESTLTNVTKTGGRLFLDISKISRNERTKIIGDIGNNVLKGTPDDEVLIGKGGNDTLIGRRGDDILIGNVGNDTLIGGLGHDRFYVIPRSNEIDKIRDFQSKQDSLVITIAEEDKDVFLNNDGSLNEQFLSFSNQNDSLGFIYNNGTGELTYNSSTQGIRDVIAQFTQGTQLLSTDILLR